MMRTIFANVFLAFVIGALVTTAIGADEPKAAPSKSSPFAGKAVVVNGRRDLADLLLLEKAEVKQLGASQFLVGVWRDKTFKEFEGKTVWIAIAEITSLVEFATVEEAQKTLDKLRQEQKARQAPAPPGVAANR